MVKIAGDKMQFFSIKSHQTPPPPPPPHQILCQLYITEIILFALSLTITITIAIRPRDPCFWAQILPKMLFFRNNVY